MPTTQVRMSAAERREQLLDVTKRIVAERGFHEVSIEAVARRAGITRPVVYGHFRDLTGLLDALVDRESERALRQLEAFLPTELAADAWVEALLAALGGYLRAAAEDPATWRLILMPPEGAPEILRERIARGRSETIARLAHTIGPGLAPGRGSPDPELTAHTLSSFADEAARLLLTDPARYPAERIIAQARWLLGHFSAEAAGGG